MVLFSSFEVYHNADFKFVKTGSKFECFITYSFQIFFA